MDRKKLHHYWTKLRPVSYWYFFIVFVISLGIAINALRHNNLRMIELRNKVTIADKQDKDVEKALRDLRGHIYSHMNTNLASGPTAIKPPIQLKYSYERLLKAEKARVKKENSSLYNSAQSICQAKHPGSVFGGAVASCVADYIVANTEKEKTIDDSLYKFDFVSPVWTPDLAGWSLVIAGLFLFLFLLRFSLEKWAKSVLRAND